MNEANTIDKDALKQVFEVALERIRKDGALTLSELKGMSESDVESIYAVGYNLASVGKYEDAVKIFRFFRSEVRVPLRGVLSCARRRRVRARAFRRHRGECGATRIQGRGGRLPCARPEVARGDPVRRGGGMVCRMSGERFEPADKSFVSRFNLAALSSAAGRLNARSGAKGS